jgi:hypothetical protein
VCTPVRYAIYPWIVTAIQGKQPASKGKRSGARTAAVVARDGGEEIGLLELGRALHRRRLPLHAPVPLPVRSAMCARCVSCRERAGGYIDITELLTHLFLLAAHSAAVVGETDARHLPPPRKHRVRACDAHHAELVAVHVDVLILVPARVLLHLRHEDAAVLLQCHVILKQRSGDWVPGRDPEHLREGALNGVGNRGPSAARGGGWCLRNALLQKQPCWRELGHATRWLELGLPMRERAGISELARAAAFELVAEVLV